MARERPVEAEILAQLPAAAERGRMAAATEPRAKSAYYDPVSGRVTIELTNGCLFAFPPELAQGLGSASAEELATVEVMPGAESIYWECLDTGFSVPNLITGSFGTKAWMRELGRAGGRVRSSAKAAAVRENGKKGGRPRKTAVERA
jgi:hypothetical protein